MKWTTKILFIIFGFGIFTTSCEKKECEDPIPSLSYNNFTPSLEDSTAYLLIFDFSDCDGDIGMAATDSILDENGERQGFNSFIDIYYVQNGLWFKHEFKEDEVGLDYKIPVLQNSNQNPSLEGEIETKLYESLFEILGYDTIKFRSRILDNAGHYSNEVETPAYVL